MEGYKMMNKRENYLALLNHEPTDWVPVLIADWAWLGGQAETWENGPLGGGLDGFGNGWIPTDSAAGQPALDPMNIPLEDPCDWQEVVKFPDLDAIDWKKYAEEQLAPYNRDEMVIEYHTWNSVFLRATHLLGFENALCSFLEEPEAMFDLCDAIADYKIRLLERVKEYINPDAYVHYDDVATGKSLFMSLDVYRKFIKPAHKKMNDAAKDMGIIPVSHICGKCDSIIEDVMEEGAVAWQAAQPCNDIVGIIEKYGDRFSVIGGYDTQGAPGMADAPDDVAIAEVERCMEEYGKYGRAYGFFGLRLGKVPDDVLFGAAIQKGHEIMEKVRA